MTQLSVVEERLVDGLRDLLAGRPVGSLPEAHEGDLGHAVGELAALLGGAREDDGWVEAAAALAEECHRIGWSVGLCVALALSGLPALERVEDRITNRPEALRREAVGWRMLSNVALSGHGSSLRTMAPLLAIGEADRLEREADGVDQIDLTAEAAAIEHLVDAASRLRIEEAIDRAAVPLLEALAADVADAVRAGRWDQVAGARGRYLSWWHRLRRTSRMVRSEAVAVRPYLATCRLLGQNVGLMHHRAQVTSGALLLENVSETGVIRTFESAAASTAVEDLVSLRFQLWGPHLKQFHDGYLEGYEDDQERGYVTLVMVDRLAQAMRSSPDDEGMFPTRHLELPHFVVRASGYLLRNDRDRRPHYAAVLDSLAEQPPQARIETAVDILVEAADIDENAAQWAASIISTSAIEMGVEALELLEFCIDAAEDVAPARVEELRGIVWFLRSGGDPRALRNAATWFRGVGQWGWARESLRFAMQKDPEVVVDLLRTCLDQALETGDNRPAAEVAAFDVRPEEFPEPLRRRIEAHLLVAHSFTETDRAQRHALVRQAIDKIADLPDTDGFRALITDMVPPWEQRDGDELASLVPFSTMDAIYQSDPMDALQRLRADLNKIGSADAWALVAARLAAIANHAADMRPHRQAEIAELVLDVTNRYRELPAGAGVDRAANNIGWTAVRLHSCLPENRAALLDAGIELLERAIAADPDNSAAASNLAMGYRSRAGRFDKPRRVEELHRGRELMERVVADDRLLADENPSVDFGLDLDHLNLGLIQYDLAEVTYEAQWIHRKSMESARWYRRAAQNFALAQAAAEKHNEFARAGTAESMLAKTAVKVCEWYVRERTSADGDLQRAMYDWLCTVAGVGHGSSADFIHLCVGTAVGAAGHAAAIGHERNPSLLLESLRLLTGLWNLAERRTGLPAAITRDARMTALETLQRMSESDERFFGKTDGLRDLRTLLNAQLRLDLHELTGDPRHLSEAYASFRSLIESNDAVVRALARPRAEWLDTRTEGGQTSVRGLSLRPEPDGLALRINAQARDVHLNGLAVETVEPGVMPTADVRELSRFAVAHLRPMMDWDSLPTSVARVLVTGQAGGAPFELTATALPVSTWDTWMLRLTRAGNGTARLAPGLPFLGMVDPAAARSDPALPAVADHTRFLVFGQNGLTLHVLLAADHDGGEIRVSGTPAQPVVELPAGEVFLLVQSSPRIAASQTAFLIKSDDPVAGAACAASFRADSPNPTLPVTAVQTFAAMLPFNGRIPPAVLDTLRELPITVVVMIGLPDDRTGFDTFLEQLVDPRRELLMVVDADEYPAACTAAERLRSGITARLSAGLLESAASFGSYHETLSGVQVVRADRASAPAAVQMLLDLAALRRINPDDIPELVNGTPVYMSTKGNAVGARRLRTLFRAPVDFPELLERYCDVTAKPNRMVMSDGISPARERLMSAAVPRRPVLMMSPDDPAVVAAVPLARHLGAIVLFASDDGIATCTRLAPEVVHATAAAAELLPAGEWTVRKLPSDLAGALHRLATAAHDELLAGIPARQPELLANRGLLAEMAPSGYAMLVTDSPEERPWAFLAANYAAALNAPVLLLDGALPEQDPRIAAAAGLLGAGRDLAAEPPTGLAPIELGVLGPVGMLLTEIAPSYLGFMTARADFPIELVGDPPIATRYAVGRLAGPDLDSTALLLVRAALAEDVARPARITAVVADAGLAVPSRPLPGARAEAEAVQRMLAGQADVTSTFVQGDGDLFDFVAVLPDAGLVHFAGHGRYDPARPHRSGLVFSDGILVPAGLPQRFARRPIVFGNACESAGGGPATAAWTGLAANFLLGGATNYVGSLWPIYDATSQALAEEFYRLLCDGVPVGEALRRARVAIRAPDDPTWAAFVLFGCPRIRIRPAREG